MMIKFRGRDLDSGQYKYFNLENAKTFLERYDIDYSKIEPYACEVGNGELYDGDEIRIDMEKAAQIVGDGLMLSMIKATKPNDEAKLYVEYSHYRYRLIWRTPNGRVDTGLDLALISNILECVEVVR